MHFHLLNLYRYRVHGRLYCSDILMGAKYMYHVVAEILHGLPRDTEGSRDSDGIFGRTLLL